MQDNEGHHNELEENHRLHLQPDYDKVRNKTLPDIIEVAASPN